MVFSFLVPCGTTPLFMNVCFILSDSSLHDWVLETRLSFVAVSILFRLCFVSQGSPGSGSLWDSDPVLPIGLLLAYWFWLAGPFLYFMDFKTFFPSWVFGSQFFGLLTIFFFLFLFSSLREPRSFISLALFLMKLTQCVISLGLGLWLILNLNNTWHYFLIKFLYTTQSILNQLRLMLLFWIIQNYCSKTHYKYLSKPKLCWISTNNESPWGMKTHDNMCHWCLFCRPKYMTKEEQAQVKRDMTIARPKGPACVNRPRPKKGEN